MASDILQATKAHMLALAVAHAELDVASLSHKWSCGMPLARISQDRRIPIFSHQVLLAIENGHAAMLERCLEEWGLYSDQELHLFHIMQLVDRILWVMFRLEAHKAVLARAVLVRQASSPRRYHRIILLKRLLAKLRSCVARARTLSFQELHNMLYLLQALHVAITRAKMTLAETFDIGLVNTLHNCHAELVRLGATANGMRFSLAQTYTEILLEAAYENLDP